METTANFKHGMALAHQAMKATSNRDIRSVQLIQRLLDNPVMVTSTGDVVWAMRRAHRAVRRLYFGLNGNVKAVDWTKIVDWLVEHWDDIVRAILSVLPFLI